MAKATLVNYYVTRSTPPYTMCDWEFTAGVDSTSDSNLIVLPLHDSDVSRIDLKVFSISCNSTNFRVSLLDRRDITLLDTNHEILKYTGENLAFCDNDFDELIIINHDNNEQAKLYLYVHNHDVVPTGIIYIKMVYLPVTT